MNLYVRNKTSEKDEERKVGIQKSDFLFSVESNSIISVGREKRSLHLTILRPKTEERAKGDEISLEKIVEERIQNKQIGIQIKEKFQGKHSKNLKKSNSIVKYLTWRLRLLLVVVTVQGVRFH